VRAEVGLPVSIGVARTKHLAKVASQVAKPDGLVVVPAGGERTFLDPLPVELMWGVGPATETRLHALGVRTIGELAAVAPDALQHLLGNAHGTRLAALAQDDDPRQVTSGSRAKSVGAQSALGRRPASEDVLDAAFARLADRVASRMRAANLEGRTVTVRVRFPGMRAVTRSVTFPDAVASTRALAEVAVSLAARAVHEEGEDTVTLVAVSVSHLRRGAGLQLPLPFEPRALHDEGARWALDRSVDAVREKFGRSAVGYTPVVLGGEGSVPDDFRALAEHDLTE
jgi:DNA polymerase-4